MPRGFLAALLGPEDAPNWEAPVPPRHRPLQGVKDTPLDASVAVCPFPTSRRWAHLSSFLAGEVHFHAPIDNAAANSTYTTSSREDDDTSPFSAKQALAPGTGYWCSTGKHEPKDLVIWTGIMHKRRKVRALKVSWASPHEEQNPAALQPNVAYAPGWVRVRSTPDGKHWDTVVPWHKSKEGGVSFQEDMIFDRPRHSMQVKVDMKRPKEWGYFGINQASLELA